MATLDLYKRPTEPTPDPWTLTGPSAPMGGPAGPLSAKTGDEPGRQTFGSVPFDMSTAETWQRAGGAGQTPEVGDPNSGGKTPYAFQGVDPSSTRTGLQTLAELEKLIGRPLTETERAEAIGLINYQDKTGQANVTGTQYNTLLEAAAKKLGGTFTPWAAPPPPTPPPANPTPPPITPDPKVTPPTATQPTYEVPPPPSYTAPKLDLPPDYVAPPPLTYDPFKAPTAEDLYRDPSYQFRLDQGRKALESSRAAQGIYRGGETLKALNDYGQQFASQEYGNVYNRAADQYKTGFNVATGLYDRNTAGGLNAYDRAQAAALNRYNAAVEGSQAEYAPGLMAWDKATNFGQRNAELGFDRGWQQYIYNRDADFREQVYNRDDQFRQQTFDKEFNQRIAEFKSNDEFRRMVQGSDDQFRRYVQQQDEDWRKVVLAEERLKFLVQMGRGSF